MSAEPCSVLTTPMHGRAAWHRTLEARERYLAAGDPDRLPAQTSEVALTERFPAWDREAAARDLSISRETIYRKVKRLGITR